MKFTLIQRKESGPWHLRVRLNGLDQKINLGTNSKREANKVAPGKYDEFVRTATVDGAFNELTALLDRLPKEEAKRKRAEFRAKLNVAKSGDLPTMSDFWKRWEKLPSTQRRVSHIDDVARWERWIQFLSEKDLKDCRLDEIDEHVANQFALHLDAERLTRHSKLRILALLKNVFGEFADEFGFTVNPFNAASSKLSNHQVDATEGLPDKREPFSVEDVASIVGVLNPIVVEPGVVLPPLIRRNRRQYYALVMIMMGTGLRLKDAVYLQSKQIKGSVLEMSPFKTRWRGDKIVQVPIPRWVVSVINEYCRPDKEGRLMPGLKDEYDKSRQDFSKSLVTLLKRLGIKTTGKRVPGRARAAAVKGWHSFRHTYDSAMQQVVANPVLVQKAMGHASLSQTFDYTHADIAQLAQSAELLNPHKK